MRKFSVQAKGGHSRRAFDRPIFSNVWTNFYEEVEVPIRGKMRKVKDPDFEKKLRWFLDRPNRYEVRSDDRSLKRLIAKAQKEQKEVEE